MTGPRSRDFTVTMVTDRQTTSRSRTLSLPPDLQRQAATRLRAVASVTAALFLAGWLVPVTLEGNLAYEFADPMQWTPPATGFVMSVLMAWKAASGRISSHALTYKALVYLVVISYAMVAGQYWGTFATVSATTIGRDLLGLSPVAVWIVFFTALVPTIPRLTLVALAIAAAAPAVTYHLGVVFGRAPSLELGLFLGVFVVPYYAVSGMAFFTSRIIYGLGQEVRRARELGSYRLEERLGAGGMGEVWRASHRLLARPAAIKLIRADTLGDSPQAAENAFQRFEREAQVTASLRSPHTVELYDFGRSDTGSLYYVMELLDGVDLDRLVGEHGPLPPARVAHLARQACESLAEAHLAGLVHRDIKPANLYVCRQGIRYDVLKVLDFGLVRSVQATPNLPPSMSQTGMVVGTPAYMAPEMAVGSDDLDGRADLYALGCVMYWMLTGRPLFPASDVPAMLMAHINTPPDLPSAHAQGIPPDLDEVVLRCLAKDRQDRYPTATDLESALAAVTFDLPWTRRDAARWWEER